MNFKDRKPNIKYRPPQPCVDLFWVLCEDDDEKRVNAAIQLTKMVQSVEDETEREEMKTYCVSRLIKGLGSQRLLARIGFSIGLAALLRALSEVKTGEVLEIFQRRLTTGGKIASKSERIRAHVGRIAAMSAIIQAGRLANMKADSLEFIVEELLIMPEIRVSLLPVCCKVLEDIVGEVSEDKFEKHVWPKLAPNLGLAWEGCTLDRISLLLVCRETFPNIVDKSFIKKYWGPSLFCEENDAKLLMAIRNQDFTTKSTVMRERILPYILSSGRDALSIWKGIGEKMMFSAKDKHTLPRKEKLMSPKQLFALDLLCKLVDLTTDTKKILALICDPNVVKVMFMETEKQKDGNVPLQSTMVCTICDKLKAGNVSVLGFVSRVLQLERQEEGELAEEGKLSYIHHNNFRKMVDLMDKEDMERYVKTLLQFAKGKDKDSFFSKVEEKKTKQSDWCFKQLQHACCSQSHTGPGIQRPVLSLFIRVAYFRGVSKTGKVPHCDFMEDFVEVGKMRKLCESSLFKCLDQLSTMNPDQVSKKDNLNRYTELLSYLTGYVQSLLNCKGVEMVKAWSQDTQELWSELMSRINSFGKKDDESNPAFHLLHLYMGLSLLEDVKATTDVLKDIFICHDKSLGKESMDDDDDDDDEDSDGDKKDPEWVEVLTEILLQLLSQQSHLARVISSIAFKMILPHINQEAVSLILQILNPDKSQEEEMFEENDGGDDDEVDEEGEDGDDDDDDSNKASDDEDEEGDDEKAEDGGNTNGMEVDEEFRASIKEALGKAAVDDDDDDDDEDEDNQSDMSDSEMSKLDEALAEVFRQRKKKSKKGREEKRRELVYFKMRVLDLLDVLIKSDRLGDFVLDLLPPLLVLMSQSSRQEDKAACQRAKSTLLLIKNKWKGAKGSDLSEEDVTNKLEELIALANKVKDSSHLQHIAAACVLVVKMAKDKCVTILQETLTNVISKKQSKPLPQFFFALLDTNPVVFLPLCSTLVTCLQSQTSSRDSQAMACTMLTSLVKKGKQNPNEPSSSHTDNDWMVRTATAVCQLLHKLDKDSVRGLFVKELLALTLALLNRKDVLSVANFDKKKVMKLKEVRSKMGMDNKRMTNKIFGALDRLSQASNNTNGKKRKAEATSPSPKKKNKKLVVDEIKDE